jgi:hypothetical protein
VLEISCPDWIESLSAFYPKPAGEFGQSQVILVLGHSWFEQRRVICGSLNQI